MLQQSDASSARTQHGHERTSAAGNSRQQAGSQSVSCCISNKQLIEEQWHRHCGWLSVIEWSDILRQTSAMHTYFYLFVAREKVSWRIDDQYGNVSIWYDFNLNIILHCEEFGNANILNKPRSTIELANMMQLDLSIIDPQRHRSIKCCRSESSIEKLSWTSNEQSRSIDFLHINERQINFAER